MKVRSRSLLMVSLLSVSWGPAQAVDGVLEINQACAEQTGCFPGDAPGFPVTIDARGSYRLTGPLDVSTVSPTPVAIQVLASRVTLDLNGFGVFGPATCTVPTCPATHGIDAGGFTGGPTRVIVRNGFVHGMPGSGVHLGNVGVVERVVSDQNGGDGIHVQTGSRVSHSVANANGDDGIDIDDASVVSDCIAIGNGDDGVEAEGNHIVISSTAVASNGGEGIERQGAVSESQNACDDGSCSRHGRPRFYLTKNVHDGGSALSACAAGFHMASLYEITDPSQLDYDTELGFTQFDSGGGPPSNLGWVRTGSAGSGPDNCNGWTNSTGGQDGTQARFPFLVPPAASNPLDPWTTSRSSCDSPRRVWCMED